MGTQPDMGEFDIIPPSSYHIIRPVLELLGIRAYMGTRKV